MNAKPIDPRRLDVGAFVAAAGELSGEWPLTELERLSGSVLGAHPEGEPIHWQVQGEQRPVTGGEPEVWLHVTAQGCVSMQCQRCLGPMPAALDVDRWIRFVRDASQAEALDAELEEDVLELQRHMDLRELVEDELLLELPLVPRHEACPQPLPMTPEQDAVDEPSPRPNPFAALAQLKKKPGEGET
ncbi:YceD family protein [Ideonella sp. DXS29W]|uniref:Large ribosomal RNA subunit accumulation protein YceD n=1 Tax=Ideonella lacteola TaxID=2984193 RepID=A0ABU9BQT4_9BURK